MDYDIRWKQRFDNFKKAFTKFQEGVDIYNKKELSDLEKQGIIKSFEYTYELAWNLIRDYLIYNGIVEIRGARDAIKAGFKYEIIKNGDVWLEIINLRNITTHTYNDSIIKKVLQKICTIYFNEFKNLYDFFNKLINKY